MKNIMDGSARASMLLDLVGDRLDEFNKKIRAHRLPGSGSKYLFNLNQPYKVTISNAGKYSKIPLIGGETFSVRRVYVGKRGDPIFCFDANAGSTKTVNAEVRGVEALSILDGFANFVEEMFDIDFDELLEKQSENMAEEQKAKEMEKFEKYEADGFGSW